MNWSLSNTRFKILWFLSLAQSALKVEKSWNLKKSLHKLFLILRVRNIRQMFQFQCLIEKPRPDFLTFYDLSVSRNLFSKAEMRQFGTSGTEGLNSFLLIYCPLPLVWFFARLKTDHSKGSDHTKGDDTKGYWQWAINPLVLDAPNWRISVFAIARNWDIVECRG